MKLKTLLIAAVCFSTLGTMFVVYMTLKTNQTPPPIVAEDPPKNNGEVTPIDPPKYYSVEDAIASITEPELKEDLYYLASDELEGRMTGKRGNVIAAKHIKDKFESFGLETEYHKFTSSDIGRRIKGVNPGPNREQGDDFSQNIYGWIEGNDPDLKDEIVVIGAHMDHIGYGPSMARDRSNGIHPGADDNASGTVALMEIAQAFGMMKDKVKRTVVFQAYSAEEMGLLGSKFYCNNPTFPRGRPSIKKHIAMVNMDMIGYLDKGVYFAGFNSGDSSVDLGKIINNLNQKYSFARKITSRGSGGSDHANFYNKRIPVAFLHTGGHPYYHTVRDTADKINYKGVEQVARYAFELTWEICQSETRPRFNHADFKVMRVIHDHGHPETPFIHSYHEDEFHNHGRDEEENSHGHKHE